MVYLTHKFNLTNKQIKKLGSALNDERAITIKIKKEQYQGEHPLPLTLAELNKIKDSAPEITLHLSVKKLNHIKNNHEGGFLPLLSLIPLVLGGLGEAGGVAGGIASAVSAANSGANERARNQEEKRHNIALENSLKDGSGMRATEACYGKNKATLGVGECVHCGGLLAVKVKVGKGLYLSPHHRGKGLITGIADSVNPNNPLPPLPDA